MAHYVILKAPALWTFLAVSLIFILPAAAEDVVVYKAENKPAARLSGEIIDYTGTALRLRQSSGREIKLPAQRVLGIETTWSKPYQAAEALFDSHQFAAAAEQYRLAVREEKRRWAQRQILAKISRCDQNRGNIDRAASTFLIVVQDDPTTPFFDAIPLSWSPHQPSAALLQRAGRWLADQNSAAARLLGASWLLSTNQRSKAIAELQNLAADKDIRIAHLAEAQLWRTKTVTATEQDLNAWRAQIDRMPGNIRGGPYFVLARAFQQQNHPEQAALYYLRTPILFPKQRPLAAKSLFAAAGELEKIDQLRQAIEVYRELAGQFSESDSAELAKQRLESLAEEKTD